MINFLAMLAPMHVQNVTILFVANIGPERSSLSIANN